MNNGQARKIGLEFSKKFISSSKRIVYLSGPITSGLDWCETSIIDGNDRAIEAENDILSYRVHAFSRLEQKLQNTPEFSNFTFINPVKYSFDNWSQDEYYTFWSTVIECVVDTVVMLPDWQYSNGACIEFQTSVKFGKIILDDNGNSICFSKASNMISSAIEKLNEANKATNILSRVLKELINDGWIPKNQGVAAAIVKETVSKDEILFHLSHRANVAQFVSFGPASRELNSFEQRYTCIRKYEENHSFTTIREAVSCLLENSQDKTVNVRSYSPGEMKGGPLLYGKKNIPEIEEEVQKIIASGRYAIINETIDIHDNGVSGVVLGDLIEFAPDDTPRAVEKSGICSLSRAIGASILETIYGFQPSVYYPKNLRVEFSIHPKRRGVHDDHTIIWELEDIGKTDYKPLNQWPNHFSKMIGDKAFGLILANAYRLPVPFTTVCNRRIAPFSFGQETGLYETYFRTCPRVSEPGKYPTYNEWKDPFFLLKDFQKHGFTEEEESHIVSIISQRAVKAAYSGRLLPQENGRPLIQGVSGEGTRYMVGEQKPESLPKSVIESVEHLYDDAYAIFGPVDIEWVYDGNITWIVQIHSSTPIQNRGENIIVDGHPSEYVPFEVSKGLAELRRLIDSINSLDKGIAIYGNIGITSHFGDLLRASKIPSKLIPTQTIIH